jgi:hypothetical protein
METFLDFKVSKSNYLSTIVNCRSKCGWQAKMITFAQNFKPHYGSYCTFSYITY